jgi:diguanylate cyclase (GGDEF)-like protein
MANYDSLTGIANRANIMNQLAKTIEISNRSKMKFALFVCDLDNFKQINDEYGHIIGDKALKYAAQAVRRVLRNTDAVGRFGGDEFLIIQQFVRDRGDVDTLIDRIFEELKIPFIVNDKEIQIKLSIGVSMFPDNTTDFETLINQADSAMYEAKKREGCTLRYFETQASGFSGLNTLKNLPEVSDMVDS